ncbi:hypothetical protein HON58_03620 [Candidatus Peregrinibacteria bacterium]|nr:hypothetical protein [Candidatus Peregrinibacteria bacterium]
MGTAEATTSFERPVEEGGQPSPSALRGRIATLAFTVLLSISPMALQSCDNNFDESDPDEGGEVDPDLEKVKFELEHIGADLDGVEIWGNASETTSIQLRIVDQDGQLVHEFNPTLVSEGPFMITEKFSDSGIETQSGDKIQVLDPAEKGFEVPLYVDEIPEMPGASE